ncbi:unnamed protein product [Symbiodinium sp. KB8]|nr:unnamed protein product [Symbiodinium sp. KB8]
MVAEGIAMNTVTFNACISACEEAGKWKEALSLLQMMDAASQKKTTISYNAAMSACGAAGKLRAESKTREGANFATSFPAMAMKLWLLALTSLLNVARAIKVDLNSSKVSQPTRYSHYRLYVAKNGGAGAFCVKMYFYDTKDAEITTPVAGGSAPNQWSGGWSIAHGFNRERNTYCSKNGHPTGWLQYHFGEKKSLGAYALSHYWGGTTWNVVDWTFEGSNDGSTWTILHTKKGQPLVEGEKKMKFSLPTAPACTGKPVPEYECDKITDPTVCASSYARTPEKGFFAQCGMSGALCLSKGPRCEAVEQADAHSYYRLNVKKNGGATAFCVKMYFTDLTGTELATPVDGGSAPNEWGGGWSIAHGFNKERNTYCSKSNNPTGWLQYKFDKAVSLSSYSLSHYWGGTTWNLVDWTFETSSDGKTWKVLDTQTNHPLVQGEKKMQFSLSVK